jgi:hypothetical protein
LLARAVVAGERGHAVTAAQLYEQLAGETTGAADTACVLEAAQAEWRRAEEDGKATTTGATAAALRGAAAPGPGDAGEGDEEEIREEIRMVRALEQELDGLPLEAQEERASTRLRLAKMYAQRSDGAAARTWLELVLSEDPKREEALSMLVLVYGQLGLFAEAAGACDKLARVRVDPAAKAQALYDQGELLRNGLRDDQAAHESYLKSFDLDASFLPTLYRLVDHYWRTGDVQSVADIGADILAKESPDRLAQSDVALVVALSAAAVGSDDLARTALASSTRDEGAVDERLAELDQMLGARAPEALKRVRALVR